MSLIDRRNRSMLGGGLTVRMPRPQPAFQPQQQQRPAANQGTRLAPVPTPTPEQMPGAQEDEGQGWGRGLGFLINNPVTQAALKPLQVLDYPRRLATLGVEQAALALPQSMENALGIASLGLATPILAVDEERVRADERSNLEKLGDAEYGFGQISRDTGNKWLDRGIGLIGDIALDPLTYATLGTGTIAGKAGRATHLNRLADSVRRADAMKALGFAEDALPPSLRGVGTMADVERMGRRGVATATNPQLRAMGGTEQGLKFQIPFTSRATRPVPGTATAARAMNQATGAAKERIARLPGMDRLRRTRNPIGYLGNDLGPAYERIITGRGAGTVEQALEAIELDNMARRYGSRFAVTAGNEVERLSAQLNKMSDAEVAELVRQAEVVGQENILTETAERVRQAAADVGVDLPQLEAGLYAMPHVLTREARDAILELMEVQSPAAALFKRITGITDQDLLQESGFLQKRRFVAGTEIPVGEGRTITLETGSIDELNSKLGDLLPNFKGKLYETDPGAAWRSYLSGVSKDVAKRRSFREAADRGFSGIYRQGQPPPVLNPYTVADTQATRMVDGVETPIREFTQQEIDTRGNRFFGYQEDPQSTKLLSKEIVAAHKELVDEYATVGEARRLEIADQLDTVADVLIQGVRNGTRAARAEMDYYRRRVEGALVQADEVREAMEAVDQRIADLNKDISDLAKLRYGAERTARDRTLSRQAEVLTEVQEAYADAVTTRQTLEQYQEMMKARARQQMEGAALEARRYVRSEVEAERRKLVDRVSSFQRRLEAREAELRKRWSKSRGDSRPPTSREFEQANELLRSQSDRMLRFGRLEELKRITDRAVVDVRDSRDEIRRQIDSLLSKANPSQDDRALVRRLVGRRDELVAEELRLLDRSANMSEEIARMGDIQRALQVRADYADWQTYRQAGLESETNALGQARRELNDFEAEVNRAPAPGPQRVELTPDEAGELERARNYLTNNSNARRWARSEQHVLDGERLTLTKDRLDGGGLLRQDGRTPQQVRKDARVAKKWMQEHPGVGRNVRRARKRVQELEAKQAQVIPAPRQAPRGPFFEQIDRDAAAMQRRLENIARNEQIIDEGVLPGINRAANQEAEARSRLGRIGADADPETTEAMLDEARTYFQRNQEIRQRRVEVEAARKAQREAQAELEETMSALGASYRENLTNYRAARAEHEAIIERLSPEGVRVDLKAARSKGGIDKTAARKPYKESVRRASAGEIPAYEAQPLHRVVADLQAVIEANPTRNDPLMNRIEAELATIEQQLDTLTRTTDIPQAEAQRILDAASKGELQPVMAAVLRDGWRQLWDNGDVVISRKLEARYHRIINAAAEPKAMGRLMTAYTNFFKTYATLSPGFHVRNAMSASFMNYSEGVSTATQLRGLRLWREYANAKRPLEWLRSQPKQVQDAFEAVFASGAGGRFFETGVADAGAGAGRMKEAIFSNPLTRLSQRVGQDWAEGPVRLSLALHSVRSGETVTDALNRITRIHFDYSQVSQFDERAKRFIPFWTFMSRNLPMQITQMWTKPRTYQKYQSFIRNFSVEPDEFTPEYILEAGGFDTGAETQGWMPGTTAGLPIFLQPDFAHVRLGEDAEKIENVLSGGNIGQLLSDFNPALTAPIEYATGRDLFTGRQYQEDDYRKAGGAVDTALMPLMALLGQTERGANGDVYYQEKGADALRSLIPILDRVSRLAPGTVGGEADERQMESVLRFLGAPVRTVSDDQRLNERRSQYYDQLDAQRLQRVLAGG